MSSVVESVEVLKIFIHHSELFVCERPIRELRLPMTIIEGMKKAPTLSITDGTHPTSTQVWRRPSAMLPHSRPKLN